MLVLKCLADESGDDPGAIVARGFLDVDEREFGNVINRLEGYFDCTLWLRSRPERRFVVDELVALVSAATGAATATTATAGSAPTTSGATTTEAGRG
ncbi:DUF6137 domain-containing protein [Streptomyces sp. NPDC089799]|uniref:DUF6137 domain-containing protein n=1 Tax=Streptomyces sp. NPDC089799 TaxID=3155066 RepID=UPI00343D769E